MTQLDALLLSLVVEAAIAAAVVRGRRWGGARRAAVTAVLATLCTHWAVWYGVSALEARFGYPGAVLAVEAAIVAAEAVAYRFVVSLGVTRALAVSLVANAASAGAGLALYALGLA